MMIHLERDSYFKNKRNDSRKNVSLLLINGIIEFLVSHVIRLIFLD